MSAPRYDGSGARVCAASTGHDDDSPASGTNWQHSILPTGGYLVIEPSGRMLEFCDSECLATFYAVVVLSEAARIAADEGA